MKVFLCSLTWMVPLAAGFAGTGGDFLDSAAGSGAGEESEDGWTLPFLAGATQTVDVTTEALLASDIEIVTGRLDYRLESGDWTLSVGVAGNFYQEDYEPTLLGRDARLDEETILADLSLTRRWSDAWESSLVFSAYDGYAEYRSIWIAEFYHQLYGAFPEYSAPDPHGTSIGASVTWHYQPHAGLVEFSVNHGRDVIAPGWQFVFDSGVGRPEADREVLKTPSGRIRVEQAINGWLKTEVTATARETTGRRTRYGIQNSWAAAHGPFSFRLTGGYVEESPEFDALYGSVLAQWNFHPQWSAHVGGRIYSDSGEIESGGFDAAAPGIDTSELFAGLTWDRGDLAVGLTVGFLETSYEDLSEENVFFANLYDDRDWWTVRLAATLTF